MALQSNGEWAAGLGFSPWAALCSSCELAATPSCEGNPGERSAGVGTAVLGLAAPPPCPPDGCPPEHSEDSRPESRVLAMGPVARSHTGPPWGKAVCVQPPCAPGPLGMGRVRRGEGALKCSGCGVSSAGGNQRAHRPSIVVNQTGSCAQPGESLRLPCGLHRLVLVSGTPQTSIGSVAGVDAESIGL